MSSFDHDAAMKRGAERQQSGREGAAYALLSDGQKFGPNTRTRAFSGH